MSETSNAIRQPQLSDKDIAFLNSVPFQGLLDFLRFLRELREQIDNAIGIHGKKTQFAMLNESLSKMAEAVDDSANMIAEMTEQNQFFRTVLSEGGLTELMEKATALKVELENVDLEDRESVEEGFKELFEFNQNLYKFAPVADRMDEIAKDLPDKTKLKIFKFGDTYLIGAENHEEDSSKGREYFFAVDAKTWEEVEIPTDIPNNLEELKHSEAVCQTILDVLSNEEASLDIRKVIDSDEYTRLFNEGVGKKTGVNLEIKIDEAHNVQHMVYTNGKATLDIEADYNHDNEIISGDAKIRNARFIKNGEQIDVFENKDKDTVLKTVRDEDFKQIIGLTALGEVYDEFEKEYAKILNEEMDGQSYGKEHLSPDEVYTKALLISNAVEQDPTMTCTVLDSPNTDAVCCLEISRENDQHTFAHEDTVRIYNTDRMENNKNFEVDKSIGFLALNEKGLDVSKEYSETLNSFVKTQSEKMQSEPAKDDVEKSKSKSQGIDR